MDNRTVSIYKGVTDTKGVVYPIEHVINRIKSGSRGLAKKTQALNKWYTENNVKYRERKKELPAVTWAGQFPNQYGHRIGKHLVQHSGLIVLDVDNDIDMGSVLADFAQNPHIFFAFVSPSGRGVKPVIPVSPIPQNKREHEHAFNAILDVFSEYADQDPDELPKQRDPNRLCFLAHDPQAIHNPNAIPVEWEIDEAEEQRSRESENAPTGEVYGDVSIEQARHVLSFVPRDLSYADWRNIGMGIKQAGLPVSVFSDWSNHQRLNSSGVWVSEDCLSQWNRFNSSGITWGSVVHIAKENGYTTPTPRKPVKLQNVQPYEKVIETLETAREFLKGVFEKGSQFFAIRTDTGTGKTENAITYAITRDVAIPTQSGDLRDEIVSRAIDKEMFAWGYRGIRETEESDGYMPCIQSERFEALRNKGFNPYKWVCDSCPAYLECRERGYLSQPDRAKQSQLLALPFPTAFLDPRLRSWADLYKPKGKNALILHDDLPLTSLFIEYQLTTKRLRQIYESWKGTLAAEWAEACLMAFQLRDWEMLKNISLGMNADETDSVRYALTQCIDPSTGAVVEPDDYLSSEQVDFSTAEACHKLPQLDKEGFDTATMLESFWEQYPRVEDAPFFFDAITDAFTFYRPPKPYIFNKSVRFGFASATLDPKLIKAIFPDVEFYDANTTEWENGAHLYQLRTNGNPRATVLNAVEKYNAAGEKVWEWDGLSETGADYYGKALSFIKLNSNETHAVLSYKNVIADKQDELDALGVRTAHFGNLAGLDDAFEGVKNFHILFCPFVKPFDVDFLCKQLFGNEETPLKRDANGNLERNDHGGYADDRAQQVNDALVTGELLQAIGRARLNLYPNRVFLWTSLFIDGVSNRDETTLFDEVDWQTADSEIEKLRDTVKTRENGEVKALAETTGQSERTARRQTQETRTQSKAERDAEIYRRYYNSGESKKGIAANMKIGRATVARVLSKSDF